MYRFTRTAPRISWSRNHRPLSHLVGKPRFCQKAGARHGVLVGVRLLLRSGHSRVRPTRPVRRMNMSKLSSISAIVAAVALLAGCSDQARTPTGVGLSASHSGVPFTIGLASPAWQEKAAGLVSQAGFNAQTATRAYPLLGVAQYLSVQRAEASDGGTDVTDVASGIGIGAGGRNLLELDRGAVAAASAVVLTYLFPSQAQALEGMVAAQANAGPGGVHPAFARGEAIGRAVGAEIVARAQVDGFNQPFTGTFPTGPGLWISNTSPPTIAG